MEAKVTPILESEVQIAKTSQPLYSSPVAAGFGVSGDDGIDEELNIHDFLVKNPTATFFVRVSGDSMEGARIFSGDVLVIDRSITPRDGSIVVAAVGGELLVKRLKLSGPATHLISENESYKAINLTDSDDCFIWGVVVGSARKIA
jgi:DNA polymerase V